MLPLGLEGLAGLAGRFGAAPGAVEPSLRWPLAAPPEVWPELPPDAVPEAAVPPPDAALFASRSQAARNAPESTNATAAANAVTFILTSRVMVS